MSRIVDVHVHVWDESYPDRPYPWTPDPHPLTALLPVLDEAGVDVAVQVTPMMKGWDNEEGLEAAASSDGRLVVFGRIDPFAPDPEARLRSWMSSPHARGARLTLFGPSAEALRDGALDPFLAAAEREQIPVAIFAPDELPHVLRALERFPMLRLIIDHLGCGVYPGATEPLRNFGVLREFAAFPQVLVKISGVVELSKESFPFRDIHELIAQARDWFTADRLLWGSNYPVVLSNCSYRESLDHIVESDVFDGSALAGVLGGNAEQLLRR